MAQSSIALQNAFARLAGGDPAGAERILRDLLGRSPGEPEALHLLGIAKLQSGRAAEAIGLLEQAVAASPSAPAYHANLAVAYSGSRRFADAVRSLEAAIALEPGNPGHHHNLGIARKQLGDLDGAVDAYRRALAIDPGLAPVHDSLGRALKDRGELAAAIASYRRAIELQPGLASAHDNLGCLLKAEGDLDGALRSHREAVRISPRSAGMHNNLAVALKAAGQLDEAAEEYRESLRLHPDAAAVHRNLANVLKELERHREMAEAFENAHRLDPEDTDTLYNLAMARAQLGESDAARGHFEALLALAPDHADALGMLGEMSSQATEAELERFRAIADSGDASPDDRARAEFGLGKIHDQRGEHDLAFAHYAAANDIRRDAGGPPMDVGTLFDSIEAAFTRETFQRSPPRGSESELPVFIVGMPRSGTTLVEQILSSHPGVHGAGELPHVGEYVGQLSGDGGGYLDPARLDGARLASLAEDYLARLQVPGGGASRVTDKAPLNFLSLGLIALLFPNARIIHVHRHPLDTCLSCYFNNLVEVRFSFDLDMLGAYYTRYVSLMDHWRDVLPMDILDVRYESLVENQEAISREMISFCGLDWHADCLAFHRNDRPIKTASMFQVRRPMYASSVGRWKAYEKHLGPLIRRLEGLLPPREEESPG